MALDPYAQLGVPRNADQATIKRAYRKLVQIHHPDKNPDDPFATTRFQLIQESYDILSTPEKKRRYDETGETDGAELHRKAVQLLAIVVKQLLDEGELDLVRGVHASFEQMEHGARNAIPKEEGKIKRLERSLKRFKFKGEGNNILADMVATRIDKHRDAIKRAKDAINECAAARVLFKDYEACAEPIDSRDLDTLALGGTARGYFLPPGNWS